MHHLGVCADCTVGTQIARSFNFDLLLDLDHIAIMSLPFRPEQAKVRYCDLTAAYASDSSQASMAESGEGAQVIDILEYTTPDKVCITTQSTVGWRKRQQGQVARKQCIDLVGA